MVQKVKGDAQEEVKEIVPQEMGEKIVVQRLKEDLSQMIVDDLTTRSHMDLDHLEKAFEGDESPSWGRIYDKEGLDGSLKKLSKELKVSVSLDEIYKSFKKLGCEILSGEGAREYIEDRGQQPPEGVDLVILHINDFTHLREDVLVEIRSRKRDIS